MTVQDGTHARIKLQLLDFQCISRKFHDGAGEGEKNLRGHNLRGPTLPPFTSRNGLQMDSAQIGFG